MAGVDYNKYQGNQDFRGFLLGNGLTNYLTYTGNDGGIDKQAYQQAKYGNNMLGKANDQSYFQDQAMVKQLYNKWSKAREDQLNYNRNGNTLGASDLSGAAEDARNRDITVGSLEQQLGLTRDRIGNLDSVMSSGRNQIEDGYRKGLNRLNQQQSNALSAYATQRGDTKRDFGRASEDINTSARNNYQAFMNLLGRANATNSSAAENLVPYAVSNEASRQRSGLSDTMGKNLRDLKTAEDQTIQSYDNSKNDLEEQKRTNTGSLERDVESKRADLYGETARLEGEIARARGGGWREAQGAMQGSIDRRAAIEKALAGLLDRYRNPYNVQDVKVQEAKLSNYVNDPSGVDITTPESANTDTSQNYLAKIEEEKKRKLALA